MGSAPGSLADQEDPSRWVHLEHGDGDPAVETAHRRRRIEAPPGAEDPQLAGQFFDQSYISFALENLAGRASLGL